MRTTPKAILLIIFFFQASGCVAVSLSEKFKQVNPSVVVIHTADSSQVASPDGSVIANTERGIGTGVIISKDGKILTAAHVVQNADNLVVKLSGGSQFEAQIISSAPQADLALIQIINPPSNLTTSTLGDSDVSQVGDSVFVIGTPYGIEHTLTAGYISGKRTSQHPLLGSPLEFIQTDAAINKGNSGGPVFNSSSELIGIVSHIRSKSGGNEGLGFAASINMAKRELLEKRPFWSGLEVIPVQGRLAKALSLPYDGGFIVQNVAKNSIAGMLGLRASTVPISYGETDLLIGGDVITHIGDIRIDFSASGLKNLFESLEKYKQQDSLTVTIIRSGQEIKLKSPLN